MSSKNIFRNYGIPKSILFNGLGRYILPCQRITIKFCKSHGSSRGVREFIENDLIDFANNHPSIVVYVKPRRHRTPVVVAEYINDKRKWLPVHMFTREDMNKWLTLLSTGSGFDELTLTQKLHTLHPSIQGPWTPFCNRNPELNLVNFPQEKLSTPSNMKPSATEELIRLFKEQKLCESQQ